MTKRVPVLLRRKAAAMLVTSPGKRARREVVTAPLPEARAALVKANALQRAIFNSVSFSAIATDATGVIQIFNVGAERMLGYAATDVLNRVRRPAAKGAEDTRPAVAGMTPADISDPDELVARAAALSVELGTPIAPGFEALVFKASRGIEDIYELTYLRKDGSRFPAVVSVTALRDGRGQIIGYLLIGTDNTARKQVEIERQRVQLELEHAKAAAEGASRTKSEFLASMSHEIRTPMNAIMGIAELLARTPLTTEQENYVQVFRRAGDNLLNLINDILDLSKVEASQLELERTPFIISDLLDEVAEMVAGRAYEKQLALEVTIAHGVPRGPLVGDPTRLRQVLLNLLGNAIKFTKTGEVRLQVTAESDDAVTPALRFTVADTGIGIAHDKVERIFERFTQADSSTTRRFGGSGLGLTISKRLVELMGGTIWVTSTLDVGSTFTFAVPFEHAAATGSEQAVVIGPDAEAPLRPLRVLLVEDSVDNCTIVIAFLARTPYQVDVATTGAAACAMFARCAYDLVLMDRQMPGMDGLTATRTMRAWERAHGHAPTPIVALTASALKGDRETCLSAGCTAFLTKPIKQEVLLRAIKEHAAPPVAPRSIGVAGAPSTADAQAPATAPAPRRVVLVEDNEDLSMILRKVLEHRGCAVTEACDGRTGISCIVTERPDFAIVDIGLPDMDGYEVARAARAALGMSVFLVAMTGHGSDDDRLEALAAGFDAHLVKPFDIDVLEAVLARQPGEIDAPVDDAELLTGRRL